MKKVVEFLKAIMSIDGKLSSKRFLAVYVFTPVTIISIFVLKDVAIIYACMSLVLALLGITSLEKFAKK